MNETDIREEVIEVIQDAALTTLAADDPSEHPFSYLDDVGWETVGKTPTLRFDTVENGSFRIAVTVTRIREE